MFLTKKIWLCLVFIFLLLWAWRPSLSVGFLSDDYEWLLPVEGLRWFQVWKLFWYPAIETITNTRYHPLVGFVFWVNFQLWHYNPFGYHLTNLVLHGVMVLGVYYVAKLLWELGDLKQKVSGRVGLIAASLFSVNPLLSEAVTWVSARYDLLASMFFLWSFVFLLLGLKHLRRKFFISSLILALVSLLAKETAVVFPVMLCTIIIYIAIQSNSKNYFVHVIYSLKKNWKLFLAFLGVIVFYFIISWLVIGRPIWASRGYTFSFSKPFLLWLVITVCGLVASFIGRKGLLKSKLWMPWFLIGISLFPVAFLPTQLRFLYLPMAFASVFIAFGLYEFVYMRNKVAAVFLWIFLLVLSTLILRSNNLSWVKASLVHQKTIFEIRQVIRKQKPSLVYVFNLPDHIGKVPVFRSHVEDAIKITFGDELNKEGVDIVVGPTPRNLSDSDVEVISSEELRVVSDVGFVVFEPMVVEKNGDGSVEVDWNGEWQARISADYREAQVFLPREMDGEKVIGLVFDGGEIRELDLE